MSADQDDFRKRHAYESWRGLNSLSENLFIWNFFLSGNEFSGWRAHRIQKVAPKKLATTEAGGQPLTRSIWKQSSQEPGKLLSVDTIECASRASAHETLLRMLGDFQGPVIERREQLSFGDVAFSAPGDTLVLFARGNLVILLRNSGSELMSMSPIASQFDSTLISKEGAGEGTATEIQRFSPSTEGYRIGERIPLGVGISDRLNDSQWYKLFSSPGEVLLEKGVLVYEYKEEGPQEIIITVVNAGRANANRSLFPAQ
jgi:hypothetical protein